MGDEAFGPGDKHREMVPAQQSGSFPLFISLSHSSLSFSVRPSLSPSLHHSVSPAASDTTLSHPFRVVHPASSGKSGQMITGHDTEENATLGNQQPPVPSLFALIPLSSYQTPLSVHSGQRGMGEGVRGRTIK